jgi:hypothetical protein
MPKKQYTPEEILQHPRLDGLETVGSFDPQGGLLSSDARKTTAFAISSGEPTRPSRICAAIWSENACCSGIPHVGMSGRTIFSIGIDEMVGWHGSAYRSR